ncbi:polyphosphate kinase [Gilvimarinus sp. SDUM040013]|uniref:Polyphosphate kinase n=1 Tax=Gilvimarinus gilvus TaxID=3058038 RepID=A0ABU4S0S3_9GAMM|nr:polyphosphate kinase [Gilvimarinus sp. SDUM040013]MDO3384563.1 polyphosphate kinase [Gilvimarinus sp. SDUM040013]MDX6850101.1 polyphosphate kinase [Gilvimarinus sp. SDUM040013]
MQSPSEIRLRQRNLDIRQFDDVQPQVDDKQTYKSQLKYWQTKLLHVQQAYYHSGKRAIIVFEGWDAAGKGGAIRKTTEKLDPRGCTVHPIGAPKPENQEKHYLYRFYTKLPEAGCLAIFDRSYYGRVLVERIEGFAQEHEWQRAFQEINEFERLLTDDGARFVKLFLHIDKHEQLKRFAQRLNDPYKRWKLTMEDLRNREKWPDYENAINDMLQYTDSEASPWHVIAAHHKWHARIDVIRTIVETLSQGVVIEPPPMDPAIVQLARQKLGLDTD